MDRAILRLAHYEIVSGVTPAKVAVNEAVELASLFSTEKSPSFINGLLSVGPVSAQRPSSPPPPEAEAETCIEPRSGDQNVALGVSPWVAALSAHASPGGRKNAIPVPPSLVSLRPLSPFLSPVSPPMAFFKTIQQDHPQASSARRLPSTTACVSS